VLLPSGPFFLSTPTMTATLPRNETAIPTEAAFHSINQRYSCAADPSKQKGSGNTVDRAYARTGPWGVTATFVYDPLQDHRRDPYPARPSLPRAGSLAYYGGRQWDKYRMEAQTTLEPYVFGGGDSAVSATAK
jgi:hypothetical protein